MGIILILFLMLGVNLLDFSFAINRSIYKRNMHVAIEMYTGSKINSKTGIQSLGQCAHVCRKNACLSFAYTEAENKCETYLTMFTEEISGGLTSTSYFSQKAVVYPDCSDVEHLLPSGVYRIALTSGESFNVYCDMKTVDGPWTVIQNRYDGSEDFNRTWAKYKKGFGDLNGEFWLGNDAIHALTEAGSALRIELETFTNITAFAEYSAFQIASESDSYRLSVTGFSGNVPYDAMAYHNSKSFSTADQGTAADCAMSSLGAWWYSSCNQTNLNGYYTTEYRNTGFKYFVSWKGFPDSTGLVPLKKTRMLIRLTHGEMSNGEITPGAIAI